MSPLAPAGSIGYNDYQRTVNYDSPQFPSLSPGVTNAPVNTGVMNVARYAYLAGQVQEVLSGCGVAINWFADQAATIQLGARVFQLSSHINSPMQFKFINLGPWAQVFVSPQSGANYHFTGQFFASNRQYPLEAQPANPVIVNQQSVPIGAGAIVQVYPIDYYAGPIMLWYYLPIAGMFINLQVLDGLGNWDNINQTVLTAGATQAFQLMTTPAGAWRLNVDNTGAATTYTIAVTPSQTGAT